MTQPRASSPMLSLHLSPTRAALALRRALSLAESTSTTMALPEIIGILQSGYLCGGGGGCPIGIFQAKADGGFDYLTSVQGDF
ncbi:MAG: hypothetical protein MUP31_08370 [Xanthomonadales bacterium]|nr:hypothetical protein [Xanthomonadales bacterium]